MGDFIPEIDEKKADAERILAIVEAVEKHWLSLPISAHLTTIPPAAPIYGREREIRQLQEWLANPQVKTLGIVGVSGIGKSTLAAYVYRHSPPSGLCLEQRPYNGKEKEFEAKFWADVSKKPDFTVFAKRALANLSGKSLQDLAFLRQKSQLIEELLKCLKQRCCLLVIDNLETWLDDSQPCAQDYQDFFQQWNERGATSTLLLTATIQPKILCSQCQWLTLKGLEPTESIVFLKNFGIQGSDVELQELASRLNNHPQLLGSVACWLKKTGTPQARHAETLIFNSQINLANFQSEKVQLVWLLEKHWQELTPELQGFLCNFSIFRRALDRSLAALFLDYSETDKVLHELASRSLLEILSESETFEFHPFVRHWLEIKALASPLLRKKASAVFQSLATNVSKCKTLEEIAIYIEIFYHLCHEKQYIKALQILKDCEEFLTEQGCQQLLSKLYEYLLVNLCEKNKEKKGFYAEILSSLARLSIELGEAPQAIEYCQQALKVAKAVGDAKAEANANYWMGKAHYQQRQYQKALECFSIAMQIFRETGERAREAATLVSLGDACSSMRKYEQAIKFYEQGREVAIATDLAYLEASARNGLGKVYQALGQYELAVEYYQQALVVEREKGDRICESLSLSRLGEVYYSLGQYQQAITRIKQALEIKQTIGDRIGEAICLKNLAKVYHAQGEGERSVECYQRLLEIKQEIGDLPGIAQALEQLWLVYLSQQQHERALDYYLQLLEIKQKIRNAQGGADAIEQLGEALDALEHWGHLGQ
ncbi:MAG: tetratricopeptide repeat protein [Oscillatoriaceae bacterium SKW80]|nr:tetratricopeptide repeat protein [Oscillatoriaceae bacterium SKYG93]MCX8122311.1 tetratricopeptide repeat protein [Oscillatoriaceae bacterium SKW80]MDW8452526.1 tetratricopeptide repeat protein [Oscillatoriaceae cyanobacterium SKYGB_i_bin93]HIK29628.1 tetratricopeptide repeat protein [Oscillatoriaceae cyanobacterium M7585_C2015_266]